MYDIKLLTADICIGNDELHTCRFSNEESVERAKRRCEWKEDAFHPIFNNSHFFASWAKTGLEYPLTDLLLQLELEGNSLEVVLTTLWISLEERPKQQRNI